MEGLPLVGTEDFMLTIQDSNENDLSVELNVNKVTPIRKDTQQGGCIIKFNIGGVYS